MLPTPPPRRDHLARLMSLWRSAGWPCRDALEIELLAAGWVVLAHDADGRDTLRLTEAGIALMAEARRTRRRALGAHDQLAEQVARQLRAGGRIVWRELALRARANPDAPEGEKAVWRLARPDVFSLRNTSVEAYLQPLVHEIKVSRADLLSDLRQADKRDAYRWLCCECHYVFPAGVAEADEIPEPFGVWVAHGEPAQARLELLRAARHAPCTLPFPVWLALAKATPMNPDDDPLQLPPQVHLGQADGPLADALDALDGATGPARP